MQKTKTLKLKTNNVGGVALAHPTMQPGYYVEPGAFVVAIERVPAHLPSDVVVTAYSQAIVDVPFDGPYTLLWDDLAGGRSGQVVRTKATRPAQRLIMAGSSEPRLAYIPRRRAPRGRG